MKAVILPGRLDGKILAPPAQLLTHELLVAAALADGESRISDISLADDIQATVQAVRALNAVVTQERTGNTITATVRGTRPGFLPELPVLSCRESELSLRLLMPLVLALRGGGVFRGKMRLLRTELGPYLSLFQSKGILFTSDHDSLTVRGTLQAGTFRTRGDISAHFIIGLLLALPLLRGLSSLILSAELESRAPVAMALDILRGHGIEVERQNWSRFVVPGGQTYRPRDSRVEGDYSLASFFYAAQGMGHVLDIQGLDPRSGQSCVAIRRISSRLCDPGMAHIDAGPHPALVPAIAVQAALRSGETTRISNVGRLRTRESDRLSAVSRELRKLGARIEEFPDHLDIHGLVDLKGGDAQTGGDPRIAMMLAVAATRASGPVGIIGAECVNRVYPDFWSEYTRLGGVVRLLDDAPPREAPC